MHILYAIRGVISEIRLFWNPIQYYVYNFKTIYKSETETLMQRARLHLQLVNVSKCKKKTVSQTWSLGPSNWPEGGGGGNPGGIFGGNPIGGMGGIPMLGGGPIHPPPGGIFWSFGFIIGGIIPMGGIGGGIGGIPPSPPIGGGCMGGGSEGAVGGASAKSWWGLSVWVRGLLAASKRSIK